jgi:hypothetical protein
MTDLCFEREEIFSQLIKGEVPVRKCILLFASHFCVTTRQKQVIKAKVKRLGMAANARFPCPRDFEGWIPTEMLLSSWWNDVAVGASLEKERLRSWPCAVRECAESISRRS